MHRLHRLTGTPVSSETSLFLSIQYKSLELLKVPRVMLLQVHPDRPPGISFSKEMRLRGLWSRSFFLRLQQSSRPLLAKLGRCFAPTWESIQVTLTGTLTLS